MALTPFTLQAERSTHLWGVEMLLSVFIQYQFYTKS